MNRHTEVPILNFLRRFWPVFFLAVLPLIPLYRAVFMGEAIGPFDQIRQMAPWNGTKPAQPWDVLQADGVLQFYVWRDLVFDAWGKNQIPFWNTYQLAGTPLLGNSQSGALYPPHILIGILRFPTATGMTLLAWFHLFWAGLGAYFLCRRLSASKTGASVAGSAFLLSNFMIAWTGLPSVIETVAWIPWTLGLAIKIFDETCGTDPKKRFPHGTVCFLAGAVAMMILAGHLQFVAYGFIGMTVVCAWLVGLALTDRNAVAELPAPKVRVLRFSVRVVLSTVIGLCIAAPQLLAVLSYSQFSHRRNVPSLIGYESFSASAIQPNELAKVIIPTLQGNPRLAADALPISTYYPALLHPGANFAESAIGLGIFSVLLLCLLPFVTKRRDPVWAVGVVGLIGLLIAFGTPINRFFYFLVPGWSSTGSPGRAVSLFVLAACVAAGLTASRLPELKLDKVLLAKWGGLFGVLVVTCMFLLNNYSVPKSMDPAVIRSLKEQAEGAALTGCIGILVLSPIVLGIGILRPSVWARLGLIGLPVLSSIAFLGSSLVQTGTPDLKATPPSNFERIAVINSAWDLLIAQRATLPPNLAALNRIHSIDGYDSLIHRDTVELLRGIDAQDPATPANGNMMFIKPSVDLVKLADAGVTEIWSTHLIIAPGLPRQENGLYKYRMEGPGRASIPNGSAEILSESTTGMKLHAVGPGKLTIRERNMPGWSAVIDGKAVSISGSIWIEIELGSGDHQVELNYSAPGFSRGLIIALFACCALIFLAIGPIVRQKSTGTKSRLDENA